MPSPCIASTLYGGALLWLPAAFSNREEEKEEEMENFARGFFELKDSAAAAAAREAIKFGLNQ